jgi:acyl-CoA thioesterase I
MIPVMTFLPCLGGGRSVDPDRVRRPFFALVAATMAGLLFQNAAEATDAPPGVPAPVVAPVVMLPHVAARLARHEPLTIVAFGSSSTEGVGASSPARSYPAMLQVDLLARLGTGRAVTVLNRGIGGEDADDMMLRLAHDVVAAKPDLVIWQTGTNDPLRKLPLDRFVAETRDGIARMRAAGMDVVLMEPQDCRMMRATPGAFAYLDAVRQIGAEMGVPVVHRYDMIRHWLADGTVTEAQLMAPDGLHMADEGYRRLAIEVARELLDEAKTPSVRMPTSPAKPALIKAAATAPGR